MRQVCNEGPGHFLGHGQTLDLMQSDYVYPEIGDRASPKEWIEQGSTNINQRAQAVAERVLASHYPDHIPADLDARLRKEFPVKLPRKLMKAGKKQR